jgi:hypothetical protein
LTGIVTKKTGRRTNGVHLVQGCPAVQYRGKETGERRQETGERETGGRETGEREAGERETGERETGERETGERETGERETGNGKKVRSAQEAGRRKKEGRTETGERETGKKCAVRRAQYAGKAGKVNAWRACEVSRPYAKLTGKANGR